MRALCAEGNQAAGAIVGDLNGIALHLQFHAQELGELGLIINKEQTQLLSFRSHSHRCGLLYL